MGSLMSLSDIETNLPKEDLTSYRVSIIYFWKVLEFSEIDILDTRIFS